MHKFLLFVLAIIVIAILAIVSGDRNPAFPTQTQGLRDCPNEKIINRMPGPGSTGASEYYVKDGTRREISEYDNNWVMANCNVPVQEVY
ncbi:MAG: hypothetical protein Q8Q03_03195 [bacterium]|nr:hypothetical protein [bacterium]